MNHPALLDPHLLAGDMRRHPIMEWIRKIPMAWLIALASSPSIIWFIKRIDDGSDEPLGLLALAFAVGLAWRERDSLQSGATERRWGTLMILSSVLAIGTLPPMLRAAIAVAGAGTWFGIHRKPGLMGLLILSLPVMASLQFYAGFPMRVAAAEVAVRSLELGGIVVTRNGVNIVIGGTAISVDPACSGIRMLWHALASAMALAAIHRASWRSTAAGGLLAVALVLPANTIRAAWLALEESGRMHGSGMSHGNIGLICFSVVLIPLWMFMSKRANPARQGNGLAAPDLSHRIILSCAAMLAPLMMMHAKKPPEAPLSLPAPETFSFNGVSLPLHPLPASDEELAFAKSFPGSLSSHGWGSHQVILRRVTQATRKLHPSRDCLRAAGYETTDSVTVRCADGIEWAKFSASRGEMRLTIHERIVSEQDGSFWTDVPAWYWSALLHPLNGPWRAETVISR